MEFITDSQHFGGDQTWEVYLMIPQTPRLTGSLGCSRSLLAAGADASIMDDHGWGILDIWSWQNHQSMWWELCCLLLMNFDICDLSWWNLYNHSDWLFLASKTFMKQWCKVRLQPCGFVWCSVWSYQWITWSAGLIGGRCSFQNIGNWHFTGMSTLQKWFGFPFFLVEKLNNWRYSQPTLRYGQV